LRGQFRLANRGQFVWYLQNCQEFDFASAELVKINDKSKSLSDATSSKDIQPANNTTQQAAEATQQVADATQQAVISVQQATNDALANVFEDIYNTEFGKVITNEAYFYSQPNINSKLKSYLIKDDEVVIANAIQYDLFHYVSFKMKNGKDLVGYVLKTEVIPSEIGE